MIKESSLYKSIEYIAILQQSKYENKPLCKRLIFVQKLLAIIAHMCYNPIFNTCKSLKRRYPLILLGLRLFSFDYGCCMERLF